YEQKEFPIAGAPNRLHLVGSRDGRDGSVTIHQDVALYAGKFDAGAKVEHRLPAGRRAWLQVARGELTLNGQTLQEGDGVAMKDETRLELTAVTAAEVLLFDLR